jgi:hypothetical protein
VDSHDLLVPAEVLAENLEPLAAQPARLAQQRPGTVAGQILPGRHVARPFWVIRDQLGTIPRGAIGEQDTVRQILPGRNPPPRGHRHPRPGLARSEVGPPAEADDPLVEERGAVQVIAAHAEALVGQARGHGPIGEHGIVQDLLHAAVEDPLRHRVEGEPAAADVQLHQLVGIPLLRPPAARVIARLERDVARRDPFLLGEIPKHRAIPQAPGEAFAQDRLRIQVALALGGIELPVDELHQILGPLPIGVLAAAVVPGGDVEHGVVRCGIGRHREGFGGIHLLDADACEAGLAQPPLDVAAIGLPQMVRDGVAPVPGVRRQGRREHPLAPQHPVYLGEDPGRIGGVLQDIVRVDRVEDAGREREPREIAARDARPVDLDGLLQELLPAIHPQAEPVPLLQEGRPVARAASQIEHPGAIPGKLGLEVRRLRFVAHLAQDRFPLTLHLQLENLAPSAGAPVAQPLLHRLGKGHEADILLG